MSTLTEISETLQAGRAKLIKTLIPQALEEGIPAQQILQDGLLAGMEVVGRRFKANEIFVPEVLVAARAMSVGAELLKPYLAESGVTSKGKVVLGTVKGDLHDIGKNLVRMMLEGKGLTVIDLGVDLLQGYYLSRPTAVPSPIASEALDVIRAASAAHSNAG